MMNRFRALLPGLLFTFAPIFLFAQNYQVTITGPTVICGNDCVALTATASAQPPTTPFLYQWRDANGQNLGTGMTITVCQPGTYTVIVTYNNDAVVVDTHSISLLPFVPIQIASDNPANCNPDSSSSTDPDNQFYCEKVCPNARVTYYIPNVPVIGGSTVSHEEVPLDAIFLGAGPIIPDCGGILNCSFELGFDYWDVQLGDPDMASWTLASAYAHTGQFSALAEALWPDGGAGAVLKSVSIPIESTSIEYRFSFYVKTIANEGRSFKVSARIYWYRNGSYIGDTLLDEIFVFADLDWNLEGQSVFECPYIGADEARVIFEIHDVSVNGAGDVFTERNQLFLDDVSVESQPGMCPLLNQ